jgi:hypothetical protein
MSIAGQAVTSPTTTKESETVDKASGTAGVKFGVNVGGTAEFQQVKRQGVEQGGDVAFDLSGMHFSRDMQDHDNLFDALEKQISDKGFLSDYDGGKPKTSLIRVNGLLKLTDWSAILNFLKNAQSLRDIGVDMGGNQKQLKAMAQILQTMTLPEIIANFSVNGHSISAPLDLQHLNMPIEQLRASYATHSALKASMLAITPVETDEIHVTQGTIADLDLGAILSSIFGSADLKVFPIAIYLDL